MKHSTHTVMLPMCDRELIKFALAQLSTRADTASDTKVNCARLSALIDGADIDIHKPPMERKR